MDPKTHPAEVEQIVNEREEKAELERRIRLLVTLPVQIEWVKNKSFWYGVEDLLLCEDGTVWAIYVPAVHRDPIRVSRSRLQAAIDAHREATRAAEALAREPAQGTSDPVAQEIDNADGPWFVLEDKPSFQVWHPRLLGYTANFRYGALYAYTREEALRLAEAEAARLNAKWREEQKAKAEERRLADLKAKRIKAFVARGQEVFAAAACFHADFKHHDTFYVTDGGFVWSKNVCSSGDPACSPVSREELLAALHEAGIEPPLTPEQETAIRNRVEYARRCAKEYGGCDVRKFERNNPVVYLGPNSAGWCDKPYKDCTIRITQEQIAAWERANPDPEEIGAELRERLEKRLLHCVGSWFGEHSFRARAGRETYLDIDGQVKPYGYEDNGVACTHAQALAFLREKGIEL